MEKQEKIILIVEDDTSLRVILKEKLKNSGFKVLEAFDGNEGLEKVFKFKPDMILLDIIMPNMDGITMLKKLREDKGGKNIPVIILTNLNDVDSASDALNHGVFDYLVKTDWKLEDLIKKIKQRLKNSHKNCKK